MGIFSRFERKVEDTFEGSAGRMFDAPISPVQIAKKAEKQMRREKMVGAGKQYAPTLYTVLVNDDDDQRLFGYYPTLAGETETYLAAKAVEEGLVMDGQPLVRFIVDEDLKRGKFDVVAEPVAAPIIAQLRQEEMERYGLATPAQQPRQPQQPQQAQPMQPQHDPYQAAPQNAYAAAPQDNFNYQQDPYDADLYAPREGQEDYGQGQDQELPYVPENEIDYSIDYGEYTFNSEEFTDQQRERSQVDSQPFTREQHPASNYAAPVADAAMAAGAAGMAAAAQPIMQPTPQVSTPDTVVFAAGNGNAAPTPQASMVRARLVNVTENRAYDLATARVIIGRDINSSITVDDINASRSHAELRLEPQGAWSITDLGSTNGTFVNGREITGQYLSNNDKITIGMTTFVFTLA